MTYSGFLLAFLVVPIAALLALLWRRLRRFHLVGIGLVCLLAFVYTTPWDNYAAYKHLWYFDEAFVWGRPFWFGYLPLEEYLFYLAEAVFVCLALLALARVPWLTPPSDESPPAPNNGGAGGGTAGARGDALPSGTPPIIGGRGGLP